MDYLSDPVSKLLCLFMEYLEKVRYSKNSFSLSLQMMFLHISRPSQCVPRFIWRGIAWSWPAWQKAAGLWSSNGCMTTGSWPSSHWNTGTRWLAFYHSQGACVAAVTVLPFCLQSCPCRLLSIIIPMIVKALEACVICNSRLKQRNHSWFFNQFFSCGATRKVFWGQRLFNCFSLHAKVTHGKLEVWHFPLPGKTQKVEDGRSSVLRDVLISKLVVYYNWRMIGL